MDRDATFTPAGRADYGAFYTPAATADLMVELLEIVPGQRVLEPSAGEGAFIDALVRAGVAPQQITAWELDPAAAAMLAARHPGIRVEVRDTLLDTAPASEGGFDAIIGNPPYLNKRSAYVRAHRERLRRRFGALCGAGETFVMFSWLCLDLLAPTGQLCLLVGDGIRTLPTHARFRRRLMAKHRLKTLVSTPPRLFEGASVATVIVHAAAARSEGGVRVLARADAEDDYRGPGWAEIPDRFYRRVPGTPLLLEAPESILALFEQPLRLGDWADGHIGMHTRDNPGRLAALEGTPLAARFERRRVRADQFRVIDEAQAAAGAWRPYLKEGGDKDFWHPLSEFIDWAPEAQAGYVMGEARLFGREGLAVSGVSRRLSVRLMPAGCMWDTNKVIGLVPHEAAERDHLLALLNSDLYTYLAKAVLNGSASLQLSDLRRLPVPRLPDPVRAELADLARELVGGLRSGADGADARRRLNEIVYRELEIDEADIARVRAFLGRRGLPAYG